MAVNVCRKPMVHSVSRHVGGLERHESFFPVRSVTGKNQVGNKFDLVVSVTVAFRSVTDNDYVRMLKYRLNNAVIRIRYVYILVYC